MTIGMEKHTQVTVKLKEEFNNIHFGLFKIVFSFAVSLSLFGCFSQKLARLLCLSGVCKPGRLGGCCAHESSEY